MKPVRFALITAAAAAAFLLGLQQLESVKDSSGGSTAAGVLQLAMGAGAMAAGIVSLP